MANDRVQGVAQANALFDRLSDAARDELAIKLADIGDDLNELQISLAPERTGAVKAALSVRVILDQLKVRAGLFDFRSGRHPLFYAAIIEGGRRGQTVRVRRRKRRDASGRRRANSVAESYSMQVSPREARPFIRRDVEADLIASQRLADFWENTLNKAGAGG